MGIRVFPTVNNLEGGSGGGAGKEISEYNLSTLLQTISRDDNFVYSGLTMPSTDADLSINIATGVACISGRYLKIQSIEAVALTASETNYIYIELTLDGNLDVTSAAFTVNITGTQPANSVYIGMAITDATTVTSTLGYDRWLPELSDASGSVTAAGQTYFNNVGKYRRHGDIITFSFNLTMSSLGTLSGNAYILGLPIQPDTNASGQAGAGVATLGASLAITAGDSVVGLPSYGKYIQMQKWNSAAGTSALTCAEISANGTIYMYGSYIKQ